MATLPKDVTQVSVSALTPTAATAPQVLPVDLRAAKGDIARDVPLSAEGSLLMASAQDSPIENYGNNNIFIFGGKNTVYMHPGEPGAEEIEINDEETAMDEAAADALSAEGQGLLEEMTARDVTSGYIQVTNTNNSGSGSLREALDSANNAGNDVVIDVREANGTINLASSLPTLTSSNKIWVVGDDGLTISGQGSKQILSVNKNGGFLAFFKTKFADGKAKGGDASNGAGGGLGAGGALFVNQGQVIVDRSTFTNNSAVGGNSSGYGGYGGSSGVYGSAGNKGGRFNETASFVPSGSSVGKGGEEGPTCGYSDRCGAESKQHGGNGGFGAGGGSGGGGGGDNSPNNTLPQDGGRNGGDGGKGGFGAGGGGGGGGGEDDGDAFQPDSGREHGYGGSGGSSGHYGGSGSPGQNGGNRSGGRGGDGAALGGAIFVRENNGGHLQMSNSSLSGNRLTAGQGQEKGRAIFAWTGSGNTALALNNGITDYNSDTLPTLSLSLVNLDGNPTDRVSEGERAILKISAAGSNIHENTKVYFYLSDKDATAREGKDPAWDHTANNQGTDFVWGKTVYYSVKVDSDTDKFYINIPDKGASNELGEYAGIQTYIDKLVEGNESFTINLLPGEGYKLGNDYSQQVVIEDINYQAEILTNKSRTTIYDVADALEPDDGPNMASRGDEISVDRLKGLGYVTVQVTRQTNGGSDATVNGDLFNNALAGGLPVYYTIRPTDGGARGEDYFANKFNYNNNVQDNQYVDAVVVPVTPTEEGGQGDLPPGTARIYFAALPDAIKENAEHYTLKLETFIDKSCAPGESYCRQNTPDGEYQFYEIKNSKQEIGLTIEDSGEFTPRIVIADNINGEVVGKDNALVPDEGGNVAFWVKLGSQPAGNVTVTAGGSTLNFTPEDWYAYQKVSQSGVAAEQTVAIAATSTDPNYNNVANRTLTLGEKYTKLKITEGNSPKVSERTVTLSATASVDSFTEGSLETPEFAITLGQPLPRDIQVDYTLDEGGSIKQANITLPKYHQSVSIPYPIADDDVVDADKEIKLTLTGVNDPGVSILTKGKTASFTLKDDDKPQVLISQHLPAEPTENDVTYLIPQVQVLGKAKNGSPVIQTTNSLVKDIVLIPAGSTAEGVNLVDGPTPASSSDRGLTVEMATVEGPSAGDRIIFPDAVEQAAFVPDFEITDIPSNTYVRALGLLTPDETKNYTFTLEQTGGRAELWLNRRGSDAEGKRLIASTASSLSSEAISLTAGTAYYIEALGESSGSLTVKWNHDIIAHDRLTPFPIHSGFIIETWEDIDSIQISDFTADKRYPNQPTNSQILPNTLKISETDGPQTEGIGRRVRGLITPPETGKYTFWIASNGNSELRLNAEGTEPEDAQTIAQVGGTEIYGRAKVARDTGVNPYAVKVEIERGEGEINKHWKLEFEPESQPFAGAQGVTLFSKEGKTICPIYNFVDSHTVAGSGKTTLTINQPLQEPNQSAWDEATECHYDSHADANTGIYPDYDGRSLTFWYQDNYATQLSAVSNISLDEHNVSDPEIDFPAQQQWDWKEEQQKSKEIFLEQGKQYYIEALQVNYLGADHLSVAWQPPSAPTPQLLSADDISIPSANIPIRLISPKPSQINPLLLPQFCKDKPCKQISLNLGASSVRAFGEEYTVSSITLKEGAKLSFGSGFLGTVKQDTQISGEATPVILEVKDISDNQQTLNLTQGQQGRLGFQLASQPATDVTVTLGKSGAAADEIELLDPDTGQDLGSSPTLTFTSTNWNAPQFAIVEAKNDRDISQTASAEITATATVQGAGNTGDYATSLITVRVFPATLDDYYPITVQANQEVKSFGFAKPDSITLTYYPDSESDETADFPSHWAWELVDEDLVAKQGGKEVLRLGLTDLQLPIPQGTAPSIEITAKVFGDALKSAPWKKGKVTIEGITVNADSASADVTVTLINGLPAVEAHSRITGKLENLQAPISVSYRPKQSSQEIVAAIGETLVTEFGEFQIQADGQWFFEPNARLKGGESIVFAVKNANETEQVQIPLDGYGGQPRIATSLVALPDATAPLAKLTVTDKPSPWEGGKPNAFCENAGTVTARIELAQPAPKGGTNVYYTVDLPNSNDPSNIALNLAPITATKDLNSNRTLELEGQGLPLETQGKELTAEMWIRPAALSSSQGLLVGSNNGNEATLLSLSGRNLKAPGSLSATLPDTIEPDTWFHVAYTTSKTDAALYVNGRKLKTGNAPSSLPAFLKAIGRDQQAASYFNGAIDEARIWDVARTDAQIQASYSTALATDETDVRAHLKGYWNFNKLDIQNKVEGAVGTSLQNSEEELDISNPAIWQKVFQVRQAATEGEDYESLTGFSAQHLNIFNLDAEKIASRTTFAIADFNGDSQPDAAIVDGRGRLTLLQNKGPGLEGQPLFDTQNTGIILGEARSMTAGDVDGDGDMDLVLPSTKGGVYLIENTPVQTGWGWNQQRSARLQKPIPLEEGGNALGLGSAVSPTLADLNSDGIPELVTITSEGKITQFETQFEKSGMGISDFSASEKAPLLRSMPEAEQEYSLQFIDLDRDGDLDALVDYNRNLPGQRPGGYHYFKNYGTPDQPYFVEAPHSDIAYYLRDLDNEATYGGRTLRHPYDQVEFYRFADWDNDGDLDLLQSDNKGLIHLRENQNLNFVTIPAGKKTADLSIKITDDARAESPEFIKLRLADGKADSPNYHVEAQTSQVEIEIEDNDKPGIAIFDDENNPVNKSISLNEGNQEEKTYAVKLTSQPISTVFLEVATSSLKNGLVARESSDTFKENILLMFSPKNWNLSDRHKFKVKAVDNQIDDDYFPFSYRLLAKSADVTYNNRYKKLAVTNIDNDKAGISMTIDKLPLAARAQGTIPLAEGDINTVKLALTSQPIVPVTVTLAPEDKQVTFYPQRRIAEMAMQDPVSGQFQKLRALEGAATSTLGLYGTLKWKENGDFTYNQTVPADRGGLTDNFSYAIDNGYGTLSHDVLSIALPFVAPEEPEAMEERAELELAAEVVQPQLKGYKDNLFFSPNQLAGQPMMLTFTPQDWNLERTVAVAAVDDDLVEYNHDTKIDVFLSDPAQSVSGSYGALNWQTDGSFSYTLLPDLEIEPGSSVTEQFYFTQSDDRNKHRYHNHTLEVSVTAGDLTEEGEPTYKVTGIVDAEAELSFTEDEEALTFNAQIPGLGKESGPTLTGVSLTPQDPTYLAYSANALTVNIQDNDKPIVRAGVDLNAGENTHPGYFTLSVLEPVGYPGGLPVHYAIYGTEDGHGATAEVNGPANGDPGPDFQMTTTLKKGILYIPEGKTRVSFPIFPIDDFTPEESLAARYEKVAVEITEDGNGYYVLDNLYPETQTAAVRILDNEEVGLKFVLPAGGLTIDEGEFNGFRVGLKSQPQQPVAVNFYYDAIRANGQLDGTYLEVPSVKFDRNNWNQWQVVDVGAFNNLIPNDGDLAPRYTEIYFSVDRDGGSDDPFYSSKRGAINQILDGNQEAQPAEGKVALAGGNATASGDYGAVTLQLDVSGNYIGDYDYDLTANLNSLMKDETFKSIGKVLDIFDYTLTPDSGNAVNQQLAVEIRALSSTTLKADNLGQDYEGDFGKLNLAADGTYVYTLDRGKLPPDGLEDTDNWTVRDSFVYRLKLDEESETEQRYALNIAISHNGETDKDAAVVNGQRPVCESESDGNILTEDPEEPEEPATVCNGTVSGAVVVTGEQSLRAAGESAPIVTALGRTAVTPVVANMYLRDSEGNDLRDKKGKRVLANPIFDSNHIGFTDDSIEVDDDSDGLAGAYGTLDIHTDGSYTYSVDVDALTKGLGENDDRTVRDRFRYYLNNEADGYLELVSAYKSPTQEESATADSTPGQLVVLANGITLTRNESNPSIFEGNLTEEPNIKATRIAPAHSTIYVQEQSLDPVAVAEGLTAALDMLQSALYDADIPMVGRLGGGNAGQNEGTGNAEESRIPSFTERMEEIWKSGILAQPHFTTKELEKTLKKALNAVFGAEVPLTVLRIDTEKVLIKLGFGYSYSAVNAEFETDAGIPDLFNLEGQFVLTPKFNIDMVFGVQFRSNSKNGTRPGVFFVVDEDALDNLLGDPQYTGMVLYQIQTRKGSVPPNGVEFQDGKKGGKILPPQPTNTINSEGEFNWVWGELAPNIRWKSPVFKGSKNFCDLAGSKKSFCPAKPNASKIVGLYTKNGKTVKAIEISVEQPQAIRANTYADLQITATADPDRLLESHSASHKGKRKLVEEALKALAGGAKFEKAGIIATDVYRESSQPFKATFTVRAKPKTDSSPGSVSPQQYEASVSVNTCASRPEPNIPGERPVLPASATSAENTLLTNSNKVKVRGDGFSDSVTANGKKRTLVGTNGKLNIKGVKSGSKYKWTWTYTAKAAETIPWGSDKVTTKDISFTVQGTKTNDAYKDEEHTLLRYAGPIFTQNYTNRGDGKAEPVTKLSAELGAALDISTSANLGFMAASIRQAVLPPTNSAESSVTPEVYKQLVGKYADRGKLVEVTEENDYSTNPAEIYGNYGTLLIDEEGNFGYRLAKALLMDEDNSSYELACNPTPEDPEDKAICQHILETDGQDEPANWSDPEDGTSGILPFMGREISCPASFEKVRDGTKCKISRSTIVISDKSQENLKLYGVPSLESVASIADNAISGWNSLPSLENAMPLYKLYKEVKAGNSGSVFGVAALTDDFFIATDQDKNFKKLTLTLGSTTPLDVKFDGSDVGSLIHNDDGWTGGKLFQGGANPTVDRVGPGKVQPVGKARAFVELALKDVGAKLDGLLTFDEIKAAKRKNFVQFGLGGDAALFLAIDAGPPTFSADIDSEGLPLPNAQFKLGMDLNYQMVWDKGNGVRRGGKFAIGVYDLGVDLGEIISEKMAPIMEAVDEDLEPIKPIAKTLTADTKIFHKIGLQGLFDQDANGQVTLLEIPMTFANIFASSPKGEKYADRVRKVNRTLEFIASLNSYLLLFSDLAEELRADDQFSEQIVSVDGYVVNPNEVRIVPQPLGTGSGWTLTSSKFVPYVDDLGHIILGSTQSFAYEKTMGSQIANSTIKAVPGKANPDPIVNSANHDKLSKAKNALQKLQNYGFLNFPILSSPLDMLKLIFGEPATLVQVDVPDFDFTFEMSKAIKTPIPAVSAIIEGDLNLGTDVDLALDTYGFQQWICDSKTPTGLCWDGRPRNHPEYILNSIFAPDWTNQSYQFEGDTALSLGSRFYLGNEKQVAGKSVVDKNELYGNAGLAVGGGLDLLVVSGYLAGGPGIGGGLDLVDMGEPTLDASYDGKIRFLDLMQGLKQDPLSVFDLKFQFYMFLDIIVKTFGATVWEKQLARFPLFEFALGGEDTVARAENGRNAVVGGTAFFDANGNGQPDAEEPLGFTDSQGRFALHVPYLLFDKNDDGRIDERDGRILLLDGVDAKTGEPLNSTLVSMPGTRAISPFTTLTVQKMEQGLSMQEAQTQIKSAFDLPQELDLFRTPRPMEAAPVAPIDSDLAEYEEESQASVTPEMESVAAAASRIVVGLRDGPR